MSILSTLRRRFSDLDRDDVLDLVGLQQRRSQADSVVPALLMFGAGVAVGVGIGMMVAPRSGRELREELSQRLKLPEKKDEASAQPAAATTPA